jgi:hypothetical protein
MSLSQQPVTHDIIVVAKICSCLGCTRQESFDTSNSYAFTICNEMTGNKDRLFFIPHGLTPDGSYTVSQLSAIEQALAYYGVDLFPLDPNLLH